MSYVAFNVLSLTFRTVVGQERYKFYHRAASQRQPGFLVNFTFNHRIS